METQNNSQKCRCVLIVEDDEAIRETIQQALEFEGYRAVGAANGQEGLEILKKLQSPCLILLDLMMPVMNGWQFVEALKENDMLATIPVVVVSAFRSKADTIKVNEFIKKPVDLDALIGIVKKYCH